MFYLIVSTSKWVKRVGNPTRIVMVDSRKPLVMSVYTSRASHGLRIECNKDI